MTCLSDPNNPGIHRYFFLLDLPPIPKTRPRCTLRGHTYVKSNKYLPEFHEAINEQLQIEDMPALKEAKFLKFHCNYFFKIPNHNHTKEKKIRLHRTPRHKRPDIDNLLKFTLDCFLPYIKDDGAVYSISGNKIHDQKKYWQTIFIEAHQEIPENFDLHLIENLHLYNLKPLIGKETLTELEHIDILKDI